MIYLDHAATAPVRREVLEAMWPFLTGDFGNPSSHHSIGESAARAMTWARASVAGFFGARPTQVTFTSGGTEADNLAIKGIALGDPRGRHIVTSPLEHEAILESCDYLRRWHGFDVSVVPVAADGRIAPADLAAMLRPDTTLVSIQLANNEIGTVHDLSSLAEVAHSAGVRIHTDAVQAAGWMNLSFAALGVDAISISGHKLGAPKGVGALIARDCGELEPILHGGGQERGRRSGTENVAGAVALATALQLVDRDVAPAVEAKRDALISGVERAVPGAVLTGSRTERLPNHASFCFPGTSGESVLLQLEERGIVCSSGSACAAGSDEASHVLVGVGLAPEIAQTAVRFTFDAAVTDADVAATVGAVRDAVAAVGALAR